MLLRRGLRVSTSIDMARNVLTRLTASAPASGGHLGHLRDRSHIGRELDDQRPLGGGPGAAHQVFERAAVGAEGHAAGVHVGAGDVELVRRNALGLVEAVDDADVVAPPCSRRR